MMEQISLPRTGQEPFEFAGELKSEIDSPPKREGVSRGRWTEITEYEADDGRCVLAVRYRHDLPEFEGTDRDFVVSLKNDDAALDLYDDFDSMVAAGIYPSQEWWTAAAADQEKKPRWTDGIRELHQAIRDLPDGDVSDPTTLVTDAIAEMDTQKPASLEEAVELATVAFQSHRPQGSCIACVDPRDKVALTRAQIGEAQTSLIDRRAELSEAIAASAPEEWIQAIHSAVEYIKDHIRKLQSRLNELQANNERKERQE